MRYLPLTPSDRRAMLAAIGVPSIEALFAEVPAAARQSGPLELPLAQGEVEVERAFGAMAAKNLPASAVPSFLGAGTYRHHIPAAVDYLIQRGEFLTAYTPYQPEIAQGTLQTLFEFQTQVALLTGMEVANASMYDGATACAEAVMMANRLTRRRKAILAGNLHPHYRDTTRAYARFVGFETVACDPDPLAGDDPAAFIDSETSCVVVQNPGFFGHVRDWSALGEACHRAGALLVMIVAEAVSLGAVEAPGAMGADIVAGEGQSLGNPMSFGGPHLGLFATREKFVRQMPGRVAGETVDVDGRRGFVLTLSAREQHIRREKATSNICTNSELCAFAFSMHLALLGEAGFTRLAALNHAKAVQLAERLAAVPGVEVVNDTFFNEFTLRLPRTAAETVAKLARRKILAGVPVSRLYRDRPALAPLMLVAASELTSEDDMAQLAAALSEAIR